MEFRDKSKSKLELDNCSVGVLIESGCGKEKFAVIKTSVNQVALLDLNTIEVRDDTKIRVEDPNFLSTDEFKKLVGFLPDAYSDYYFSNVGIKETPSIRK